MSRTDELVLFLVRLSQCTEPSKSTESTIQSPTPPRVSKTEPASTLWLVEVNLERGELRWSLRRGVGTRLDELAPLAFLLFSFSSLRRSLHLLVFPRMLLLSALALLRHVVHTYVQSSLVCHFLPLLDASSFPRSSHVSSLTLYTTAFNFVSGTRTLTAFYISTLLHHSTMLCSPFLLFVRKRFGSGARLVLIHLLPLQQRR